VKGLYTHHGPVIASRDGKWLSLREYNRSLDALEEAWLITKAGNFDEYKKAMNLRANTTNNTVYADDQGNIAYWHGNFMPRRDSTYDWSQPVDGSIAATEWKGLHELDEIVHVYNPATGWIQNCNSTPFSLSGNSSPDRKKYPAYMAPDGENFRAMNAARLLGGANDFTLDSLTAKGYDHYLSAFDELLPPLFSAFTSAPDSIRKALQEPMAILQRWDRRSGLRSVATTLAVEWGTRMAQYAPRPRSAEEASHAVENVRLEIERSTPEQKIAELAAAVNDLRKRYGSWKMEWGEVCRYQRLTGKIVETYDDRKPSLPVGLVSSAFGELPSFVSRVMTNTKRRYGVSGNSFIAAVEFGKRVKARTIVTGGESSDPASAHFSDQATMYLNGQFKDVLFYPEDVMQHVEKKYHPGEE
jgi:acyl-homoserine lactone acylase PvdQ